MTACERLNRQAGGDAAAYVLSEAPPLAWGCPWEKQYFHTTFFAAIRLTNGATSRFAKLTSHLYHPQTSITNRVQASLIMRLRGVLRGRQPDTRRAGCYFS